MIDNFNDAGGYWFGAETKDVKDLILQTLSSIKTNQESRQEDMRRHTSLYRDKATTGFNIGEWLPSFTDIAFIDRVSYNVVKQCTDTAVSKLAMSKPQARFITAAGSYELSDKARLMEKLCYGVQRKNDLDNLAETALRDAAIYGIGFIRVLRVGNEIILRRVHPSRVHVDDQTCLDGDPAVVFIQMSVPREELLASFPGEKDMIMAATATFKGASGTMGQAMIEFTEAWHISAGEEKGRYVACIDSSEEGTESKAPGVLIDTEWEGPHPLAIIRWQKDLLGFWGFGIGDMLQGIQYEINEVCRRIQVNQQVMATTYMLVPVEAAIPDEFLGDNEDCRIIKYTGNNKPEVIAPLAVNPQTYEHLDRLYQKAFEIVGISQLSATSQKPQGLNSGIALRTYLDVESQRFSPIVRQWEGLWVQIAKLIIREASRIPGFKIAVAFEGRLEEIAIEDARLAEEEFEIQVYPASSLPMSPAGRLDRVIEMAQAGMVDVDEARELLDMPDLERYNRLRNAPYEDFQKTFEYMLRTGDYVAPLVFQQLAMGIPLCASMYLRARMDGTEQERLDLLERWMVEANDMLQPEQPEMPEIGPGAMGNLPQAAMAAGALPTAPPNLGGPPPMMLPGMGQ